MDNKYHPKTIIIIPGLISIIFNLFLKIEP